MRVLSEFEHLVGERYQDDENGFEYENTRIVEFKGHIVAYRAPVLENNQLGLEEKPRYTWQTW